MSNTRTLSSVLAELLKTQSSTDDHIIVTSGGLSRYVSPTELPTANTTRNGLMSSATYNTLATQVQRIDEINERLTPLSGRYFATNNCESVTELNNRLIAIKESGKQGVYVVPIFGIPLLATIACNKVDESVWVQTLSGCVSLTDDAKKIKDAGSYLSYVQLVRYYNENGGKSGWSAWKKVVPTAQKTTDGDETNYVYSKGDASSKSVLGGEMKVFQNNGQAYVRIALWGGDVESTKKWITSRIPVVNDSANGVMPFAYFTRMNNATLTEANSSTTEVKINYPDYSNGGTKTLTLTSATSAKAGIMTSATYNTIMTSVQRIDDVNSKVNQAAFVLNEAYLPTKESGSAVAAYKDSYIKMAKAIVYGGYVAIRKEAVDSDRIFGYYYYPIAQAQAKYTDDNNFRLSFAYGGSVYKISCILGTLSHTIEADTTSLEAKIKALEASSKHFCELGNYLSEEAALEAIKNPTISGSSVISAAHLTYGGGQMGITLLQNIENNYTRQIIFNHSKLYQRAIYFADDKRTTISFAEDWSPLMGDRLSWDNESHKYSLSMFGYAFNQAYCDPIPVANTSSDGLMSKATYNTLATQVTRIGELNDKIKALEERVKTLENK